ncbi:MAG: glycosyltransferase [Planctomycetota bacterium]|nr:glycosyltransferase [Planctomycetota bacterium]
MRVLLTSIGSSGDINPFIALARELIARGHGATLLTNPYFEPTIRAAGVGFEPLGEAMAPEQVARDMPLCFNRALGAWMLIRRWFAPQVPMFVERLGAVIDASAPDLLVGHQISFGLPWVAAARGVPWATCVLSPATMLSAADPSLFPIGSDLTRAPMWYRRFAHAMARRSMSFMLDRPLNVHRRSLGLPPGYDTFWTEMFSGDATVGMWSPVLRGRAADDPENFAVCGFPWHDRSARYGLRGSALDERLERFLDEGEPPVVFTLGSVLSHGGRREFEMAAEACRRVGCRGVLVTGSAEAAPAALPAGVLAVDYAPYGLLMGRGAATVHHGGVGTTAQALRAGRPMVITPFAHDQFDHAARLSRAGVATWLPRRALSARSLAASVSAVLGSGAMRDAAARAGERVRAENGVGRAVDIFERIAAAGGRTRPSR